MVVVGVAWPVLLIEAGVTSDADTGAPVTGVVNCVPEVNTVTAGVPFAAVT